LDSWNGLTEDAVGNATRDEAWCVDEDELDRGDDGAFRPSRAPEVLISMAEVMAGMPE
jgi:hypothetical protein